MRDCVDLMASMDVAEEEKFSSSAGNQTPSFST
jgi:hypothetical protein